MDRCHGYGTHCHRGKESHQERSCAENANPTQVGAESDGYHRDGEEPPGERRRVFDPPFPGRRRDRAAKGSVSQVTQGPQQRQGEKAQDEDRDRLAERPVLGPYPLPRLYLTESLLIGRRENAA